MTPERKPSVPERAGRLRGAMHHYRRGERIRQRHGEDAVVAVVRGRVRIEFPGSGAPGEVWLRASDAQPVPAGTGYEIRAVQDAVVYIYAEPSGASHDLWGV